MVSALAEGRYSGARSRVLSDIGMVRCPADGLQAACTEQLPQLTPGIAGLGTVEKMTFIEAGEQEPRGRVEAWNVRFSVGHTMTWVVGAEQDGRFDILYPAGG